MSSPRKREKKKIVDPVNEPRAVVLTNQTYCYGETPTVVCRQHFQNIAQSLNLSVEEFAKTVLDKSIGDQLCMLRDFYKTQNEETEKIYKPLIDELSSTEFESRNLPDWSPTNSPKKITTVKTRIPPKQKGPSTKRSQVLVSSPETEVSVSNQPTKFSEEKIKKKEKSKNKSKFSSIQASIEETIKSQGASNTKEFTSISSASEDFNSNNTSEHLTECEQRNKKGTDESQSIIGDNYTDRPTQDDERCTTKEKNAMDTMTNEGEETSRDPDKDDFDTFLYGRSPSQPKAAPKKKSRLSHSTTNTSNDRHRPASPSSVHTPCERPPPHEFLTPGLTFDSTSWSPSRQRDLLSVARDIADLQKAVAAGEKLNDSVSNTILFTKP